MILAQHFLLKQAVWMTFRFNCIVVYGSKGELVLPFFCLVLNTVLCRAWAVQWGEGVACLQCHSPPVRRKKAFAGGLCTVMAHVIAY